MPLTEIAAFLRTPGSAPLDAYVARVAAREADRDRVLRYVRRLVSEEESVMSFGVTVKEVATQPYVSKSATVAIGELDPFIRGAIAELTARVESAGPPFTLYHDAVNDEADGRVEVCVPVAERREDGGELPAGPVAFTVVEGEQTDYPEILSAYDAVADWAKRHGHQLAGPPREISLSGPGERTRFEIAWPLA